MPLSQRAEILLRTLVENYIEEGQPVGSRTLASRAGLKLSSATIRSVMADLEDMGLVVSPHTSAGRVPTQAGYRLFVDSLLTVRPLDIGEVKSLESELVARSDPQAVIESASGLLSQVTHMAGVVMVPCRRNESALRQIEFVHLSEGRILVILVTDDGQVLNRVIQPEQRYTPAELVEAANYFNAAFAGTSLEVVKARLLEEIEADSAAMQRMVRAATEMARQVFDEESGEDGESVVVSGESNLMDVPELGDVRKLRQVFDAFATKRDLLHLLDRSMHGGGINIFIGKESGYAALEDLSVVTAPYKVGDEVVGTLGVVGPTRMAYNRVIPIVDVTARLVTSALSTKTG